MQNGKNTLMFFFFFFLSLALVFFFFFCIQEVERGGFINMTELDISIVVLSY